MEAISDEAQLPEDDGRRTERRGLDSGHSGWATAEQSAFTSGPGANSLPRCQLRGQHLRASLKILRWTLLGLGVLALVASLLPFIPSNASAVRVWDFPRLQVAVVLAVVLVGAVVLLPHREVWTWAFAASLVTALAWQAHWV